MRLCRRLISGPLSRDRRSLDDQNKHHESRNDAVCGGGSAGKPTGSAQEDTCEISDLPPSLIWASRPPSIVVTWSFRRACSTKEKYVSYRRYAAYYWHAYLHWRVMLQRAGLSPPPSQCHQWLVAVHRDGAIDREKWDREGKEREAGFVALTKNGPKFSIVVDVTGI